MGRRRASTATPTWRTKTTATASASGTYSGTSGTASIGLEAFERYAASHPAAGRGWEQDPRPGIIAQGIAERVDDYCATAYVYCREAQAVPRLDVAAALEDIGRREYERPGGPGAG
ncbi:MAG: hypothetical protein Kow0010_17010 [Dehalococcoidia bacterium]